MRRFILIGAVLLSAGLAGCSWFRDPPRSEITTGATVVYNGGPGGEVFSLCDRGNLVYLTKSQPAVAIVEDGCNPSVQESNLAHLAALQRLADRPNPPPFNLPTPLPVHIVAMPPPQAEPKAAVATSTEPVIVQIQPPSGPPQIITIEPSVCPACPVAPPALQSRQAPAPAARVKVVQTVDPNSASLEDLERLPGVTAKTANAIVKSRPYRTSRDLVDKRVLTEAEAQKLAPYLVIR